jgi:ATP-binding protein involved in chromosome partitioning
VSFKKEDIYKALDTITAPGEGKSLVENKNITNIVVFGN